MNQNKILELEEDIKDTLENELIKNQKENRKISIKDIKFVGQVNWQDKINGKTNLENLFIVEKEINEINEEGKERITQQKNFYLGDKCIGGTIGGNKIAYNLNFGNSEPDKINAVNKLLEITSEKWIEANSMKALKRKEIAEVLTAHLGREVSSDEVDNLIEGMDKEEIEELDEEKEKREYKDENDLSEKQTEKIKINGIQKANLDKKVDGRETLGKRLDLEEYDSIYVVYSERVKEVTANSKINNTTYSLVGMTKDGEARVLNDEFEMDKTVGNNATREQTKIRADGTATRDNEDLSVYTRKSNGVSIGCENSQGSVQMFMYQKTLEENENVGIQIETSKTPVISVETKEIMNRNKGINQKDKIQNEVEEHTEEGCNPKDVKNYDGLEYTKTHNHLSEEELNTYVTEILNYENEEGEEKIKEVFSENEIKDKLLRSFRENEDKLSDRQIVEKVKQEMNQDAQIFTREHKL